MKIKCLIFLKGNWKKPVWLFEVYLQVLPDFKSIILFVSFSPLFHIINILF